ncbi:MAG: hypothetical protein HQ564_08060 [Candidatus Saganbacteria bacterium]|nr:hypothetical protein [Candidatus Saganbacteria bacterium]
MSIIKTQAAKVLSYGGFCLLGSIKSFGVKPRLDQQVKYFLHSGHKSAGNKYGVRSGDITKVVHDPVQLTPRHIFYVTNPNPNTYSFFISVNGFLREAFRPPSQQPGDTNEFFVLMPQFYGEKGECVNYRTYCQDFPETFAFPSANLFWFAKCKLGYDVLAAFLMPLKEAEVIFDMYKKSPNLFHSLIATIFPAYNQLYPNLILGNGRVFEVILNKANQRIYRRDEDVLYRSQPIVVSVSLRD